MRLNAAFIWGVTKHTSYKFKLGSEEIKKQMTTGTVHGNHMPEHTCATQLCSWSPGAVKHHANRLPTINSVVDKLRTAKRLQTTQSGCKKHDTHSYLKSKFCHSARIRQTHHGKANFATASPHISAAATGQTRTTT